MGMAEEENSHRKKYMKNAVHACCVKEKYFS